MPDTARSDDRLALTILSLASTFSRMKGRLFGQSFISSVILCAAIGSGAGCEPDRTPASSNPDADLFVATGMRVHPIFTQIADWTNSGKPDGIEAQLEFTDQFGDPTKASGRVLFELFTYVNDSPDPRGKRLGLWPASLATLSEQRAQWNTTLRTYRFQLNYPEVSPTSSYVLTAMFDRSTGGRFFDRIVMQGRPPEKNEHRHSSPLGAE